MPNEGDHEQKASDNKALADNLEDDSNYPDSNDWVLTFIFYTALHQVERKLAENNIHSGNHHERKKNIKQEIDDRTLWINYKELKDWSEQARYDCMPVEQRHLTWGKDDLEVVESRLEY